MLQSFCASFSDNSMPWSDCLALHGVNPNLKKCSYLRTLLWRIISSAWTRPEFPEAWKQGITILAYKKDFDTDPADFRPITLQPVMSKIFTSIIGNRLYDFVAENKYIEHKL